MNDARPNRPYIDPTTADVPGLARPAKPPPEAWEKASTGTRPRTPVRHRPPPPPADGPDVGYLTRHWRGELSLVRSYWVNNMLLATPLAFGLTGLMSWISVKGDSLQVSAIVLLLGLPLLMGLDFWCIVGAWRAAGNYLREQGSKLWGWLARVTLALGALQLAASVLFGVLPNLGDYWQMARGIDPIGHATFSLSADGRSMRLDGTIGMGDAARMQALLASEAASGVRRVELVSPGGRLQEAERMAGTLKPRGHEVRVVGTCASACTIVFLAGKTRQLTSGARLGFHRASTGTYNPVFERLANQHLATTYRSLGLPQPLIDKTLDTPSATMWFAPREDLLAHALIAPMPQTLAIPLPHGDKATLADFDDALRMHPVWEALEQRKAGLIEAVARQMLKTRAAGAPDEDVQAAALAPLAGHMAELLARSSVAARRHYVQLVAAQLRALQAPPKPGVRPACRDLLDGRLDVRRQLPLGLQIRESQWLLEAAGAPEPRWLPKPASAIEIEVLNRSAGTAALGLLSRLWADSPEAGGSVAGCEPIVALLDRLAAQPPARRELAERLLFQTRL
ncbi:MAG: hypothetical protein EOP39_09135 [Rubrivivax sp.]|nr:MAG: hypothetical protein EOP39_09135 [Rubrivivax sp.]